MRVLGHWRYEHGRNLVQQNLQDLAVSAGG